MRVARPLATRPALVLLAWSAVVVGISTRRGEFTYVAIALVLSGWLLLLATCIAGGLMGAGTSRSTTARYDAALVVPALACVVAGPLLQHAEYSHGGWWVATMTLSAAAAVVAGSTLLLRQPGTGPGTGPETGPGKGPGAGRVRRDGLAFAVAAALAVAGGLAQIRSAPHPEIDVWHLLQQSSTGLVHGADMYRQHWVGSHGLQAVYPYLPWTTVLLAPFRLLLGDIRYGLLLASLLAAVVLHRRMATDDRTTTAPALLPLLLLVHPGFDLYVQNAWTEPLLVLALAVTVAAATRGRGLVAVIAFAVALACKQHVWLLLPLAAWWPAFGWRRAAGSAGIAAAAMLPWLVAGPHDMYHDTVTANMMLGVIPRALCLPSLLEHLGVGLHSFVPLAAGLLASYAIAVRRLPRDASGFALGAALTLLTVDVLNKQSFYNHYALALALLVIAMVAHAATGPATAATADEVRPAERVPSGARSPRVRRSSSPS